MTSNIRKGLLQFIFSGSYMKRWNDKLRHMELIEVDKQAHKMIVAWLLCQLAGRKLTYDQRLELEEGVVEGAVFDYLFRLIITDIKPPILYRIKENQDHYQQLASWAIGEIEPLLRPVGRETWERFTRHVKNSKPQGLAAEILAAAHLYASVWEFRLLRPLNDTFDDELPEIDRRFSAQLDTYRHLTGMPELIQGLEHMKGAPYQDCATPCTASEAPSGIAAIARLANLCGQLRFQKRWSQTPRIPETSVIGHMFIVACFAYFFSISLGACPARRVNNFFCGLFHDLPELLTRDIISPVKKSFEELGELIKEYEKKELDRRVFNPLSQDGHDDIVARLSYYLGLSTGSEFDETIIREGKVEKTNFDAIQGTHNQNQYDPKDGKTIKLCDILAAYIEAYTAMRNGITADHIQQAFWRMREQNAKEVLGRIHIGALFTDFD